MIRIAAALTCYNRVAKTVACLHLLDMAARTAGVSISAVLIDDNSTDGTSAAVRAAFPWVTVKAGSGSLYWSRGMHAALTSIDLDAVDYVLWINDDTEIADDALVRLIATSVDMGKAHGRPAIAVGATADPHSGALSYSGVVRERRSRPLSFRKVHSAESAVACDTMNGNLVLIPCSVCAALGPIDPTFEHSMGDIDYGLRAKRAGYPIYVAPGIAGLCANNSPVGTSADAAMPLRRRWRMLLGRKGVPPRSWLHLTRRHAGTFWPVYFAWPYARFMVSAMLGGAFWGKPT